MSASTFLNQSKIRFLFAYNFTVRNKNEGQPDYQAWTTDWKNIEGTVDDLKAIVSQGLGIMPGTIKGSRCKRNVVDVQQIILDIDNTEALKDENGKVVRGEDGKAIKAYKHEMTIAEAQQHPFIEQYCAYGYTSPSHTDEWHRIRLGFILPEPVSPATAEILTRYLMQHLPHDPSCKDASRGFYGNTNADFFIENPYVTLPESWVNEAIAQYERDQAEEEKRITERAERKREFDHRDPKDQDELIQTALSYIPPRQPGSGNYEECRTVLMALHNHYGDAAEAIAESWSPSIKGTTWNIRQKLRSFRRGGVSIGSLFHIAKQYGFEFPKREWTDPRKPDQAEYDAVLAQQQEQERIEEAQADESLLERIQATFAKFAAPKKYKLRERKRIAKEPRKSAPYIPGKLPWYQPGIAAGMPRYSYQEGDRDRFWLESIQKGWNVIDTSFAGAGKSHTAGNLDLSQLSYRDEEGERIIPRLLYFDAQNHRNPSTAPIEANFEDMPVRHNGLAIDPNRTTALGHPHLRHPKAEDEGLERTKGNCINHRLFAIAKSKGLREATDEASANPICLKCPFFGTCGDPEAQHQPGEGFRAQRAAVMQNARKIRLSPDSAPDTDWPEFKNAIGIWEEALNQINPIEKYPIEQSEFDSQFADLEDIDPDAYEKLRPLKKALRGLLKAQDEPRYGFSKDGISEAIGSAPEWMDEQFIDEIEAAIVPSLDELMGGVADDLSSEATTKKISSIKGKIKRRLHNLGQYRQIADDLHFQIKNAELQPGYIGAISEDARLRRLRGDLKDIEIEAQALQDEISLLEKDLEDLREERNHIRDAARQIRGIDRADAVARLEAASIQWLPQFLRVWGGFEGGSYRIRNGKLYLSIFNSRHGDIANACRGNIFLDATGDVIRLSLYIGIPIDKFICCEQQASEAPNLRRIQIADFGLAGKDRAASTDERIKALVAALKIAHGGNIGILDHKSKKEATGADGHHFVDGRGTNRYKECDAIVSIGTPQPNLGAAEDLHDTLKSRWQLLEMPGFEEFYQSLIDAEFIQIDGRSRYQRRLDESITHYYLTSLELPFEDVEPVAAIDICEEAAATGERTRKIIIGETLRLIEMGSKTTQEAIAQQTGFSQALISRIYRQMGGWALWRKLLHSLIGSLKEGVIISQALEALPDELRVIAQRILPGLLNDFELQIKQPRQLLGEVADTAKQHGAKNWRLILSATEPMVSAGLLGLALSQMPKIMRDCVLRSLPQPQSEAIAAESDDSPPIEVSAAPEYPPVAEPSHPPVAEPSHPPAAIASLSTPTTGTIVPGMWCRKGTSLSPWLIEAIEGDKVWARMKGHEKRWYQLLPIDEFTPIPA